MVVYTIYNEVLTRKYRAHICSTATLFNVFSLVIIILSPLFIAYQSLGFWLKESTYREQPQVHYQHQFFILLQGPAVDSVLGYSTYDDINVLLGDSVRIPIVKSYESDANYDGKNDYLSFTIQMPLTAADSVHSVQLLLFFDYKLHTSIVADALSVSKGYNLQNIFQSYQTRNVTTDFIGRYPVWQAGKTSLFTIKVKVKYPEETIIYRPGFWQLIKFAWIQYLAILLIFISVLGFVRRFVYRNQIVTTIPQKVHVD